MTLSWRMGAVAMVALLAVPLAAQPEVAKNAITATQAANHHVTEDHRVLGAAQIVLVLLVALCLSYFVKRKLKWPALVAEIAVGLLLGPTIFGRLWPEGFSTVFPNDPIQHALLDTFAHWGVVFLLLLAGLEIRTSAALKRRRSALTIGVVGVIIPWALGVPLTLAYIKLVGYEPPGSPMIFAAFLGITMSISAMVIITRLLHELELTGTHLGQTVLCAYAVNDVLAWVVFSAIFQMANQGSMSVGLTVLKAAAVFAGTGIALAYGPKLTNRILNFAKERSGEGTVLQALFLLAVGAGVATHAFGLTFFYGIFLAGIVVSENRAVTENLRNLLTKMAQHVMVPVYFIHIGLSVDFGSHFHIGHVIFISVASVALKFIGAWISAMMSGRPRYEWNSIGIAFTPSGVTGIVLASVALESGIIDESIVVAIVASAIVSTLVAGPWLRRSVDGLLKRIAKRAIPKLGDALVRDPESIHTLNGKDREAALRQLCRISAATHGVAPSWKMLLEQVKDWQGRLEREFAHSIGWVHGRYSGVTRPVLTFGWSPSGVTWRDEDDSPVRLAILVLLPKGRPKLTLAFQLKLAHFIQKLGENGIQEALELEDVTRLVEEAIEQADLNE